MSPLRQQDQLERKRMKHWEFFHSDQTTRMKKTITEK